MLDLFDRSVSLNYFSKVHHTWCMKLPAIMINCPVLLTCFIKFQLAELWPTHLKIIKLQYLEQIQIFCIYWNRSPFQTLITSIESCREKNNLIFKKYVTNYYYISVSRKMKLCNINTWLFTTIEKRFIYHTGHWEMTLFPAISYTWECNLWKSWYSICTIQVDCRFQFIQWIATLRNEFQVCKSGTLIHVQTPSSTKPRPAVMYFSGSGSSGVHYSYVSASSVIFSVVVCIQTSSKCLWFKEPAISDYL